MPAWNWKREFAPDYLGRTIYTLVGELVSAEVTYDPLTGVYALTYLDKYGEEASPAEAGSGIGSILRLVETAILNYLLNVAKGFVEPLCVEVESSPVEVITPKDRTAGGYDSWLVVKPDRVELRGEDEVAIDGGAVCHIHPFIAVNSILAASIGIPAGTRAAGVRWTDSKHTAINTRLRAYKWVECGHSLAGQYWRSEDGERTVIVNEAGDVRPATHADYEGE